MTDNARYSPRKVTDLADVKQPSAGPAPGANADPDVRNDLVRWLLDHGYAEEKQGYGHVTADKLAGALLSAFAIHPKHRHPFDDYGNGFCEACGKKEASHVSSR